jgi:hypothetical protein
MHSPFEKSKLTQPPTNKRKKKKENNKKETEKIPFLISSLFFSLYQGTGLASIQGPVLLYCGGRGYTQVLPYRLVPFTCALSCIHYPSLHSFPLHKTIEKHSTWFLCICEGGIHSKMDCGTQSY